MKVDIQKYKRKKNESGGSRFVIGLQNQIKPLSVSIDNLSPEPTTVDAFGAVTTF